MAQQSSTDDPVLPDRPRVWHGAVLTVTILLLVWYFGIPALALHGARDRLIQEAINFQNQLADNQRMLISNDLRERRDDVEFRPSRTFSRRSVARLAGRQGGAAASLQIDRRQIVPERMQIAYTDRYLRLQIGHPGHAESSRRAMPAIPAAPSPRTGSSRRPSQ